MDKFHFNKQAKSIEQMHENGQVIRKIPLTRFHGLRCGPLPTDDTVEGWANHMTYKAVVDAKSITSLFMALADAGVLKFGGNTCT